MNHVEESTSEALLLIDNISKQIAKKVFGQERAIEIVLGAFVLGGHVLIEGPPGVAKTLLARTASDVLGLTMKRIQFTPDLMPSDITGVYVFEQKSATFRFAPGPVFADILLADEINRTPPRTQSSLLQAMEEAEVTVDGVTHPLSDLFFVLATQNPLEFEATFPLPEAQLDRFMLKATMGYPGKDAELRIIEQIAPGAQRTVPISLSLAGAIDPEDTASSPGFSISRSTILAARNAVRNIRLSEDISKYIWDLSQATRNSPKIILGASPRAAFHLALASRYQAAISNRSYVLPDDVKSMIKPVWSHRLVVRSELLQDETESMILDEILRTVAIPC